MGKKNKEPQVCFLPEGMRGPVAPGTRVDRAARNLGVDLQSVCGGHGKCGKCRIRLLNSAGAGQSVAALSPPTKQEAAFLSEEELREGWRLACQSRVLSNAAFEVPKESRSGLQLIRKQPGPKCVTPDPAVRSQTVKMPAADPTSPSSDWKRLAGQIAAGAGKNCLYPDAAMLKTLPETLGSGREVAAVLRKDGECIGLLAPTGRALTGVALDIGTTTLAAYLCDLYTGEVLATAAEVNPQISCGEDVISRIAYAAAEKAGRKELQHLVVKTVNRMIASACAQAGIAADSVADMTCVANTCMHHLFLGIDPAGLGRSPFAPVVTRGLDLKARDLGIQIAPGAYIHMLPAVSAFVGADTVGVMLAVDVYPAKETVLIIDVGTNGEIVLASGDRLVCASCATGSALEGATLSCGMRAATGAVERVRIEPETLAVEYAVIGSVGDKHAPAAGICGSGVIDAVSQMFTAGIMKKNGNLDRRCLAPRLKRNGNDVVFVVVPAEETAGGRDIVIDQDDIRAVQMAKGAIHAGVRLLMAETGARSVDRVVLAGAFGSVIDPVSALSIGLFPEVPPEKVSTAGNAAGDGARLALLSLTMRRRAAVLADKMETLELTAHPNFQREFAMAMHFPHMRPRHPGTR
jgi:uncharacterized 2Fe-2S/4Fe-4S cluster protein (DUF4445 family)